VTTTIFNASEISKLVGKTLERIEVEDGQAAFFTKPEAEGADPELYVIFPLFGAYQDGPDTVDGDLNDLFDSPITAASYDVYSYAYELTAENGETARILCPGPRTGFRRER